MEVNDRGQSSGSNSEPLRTPNYCQHAPNEHSGMKVNCVLDDIQDKTYEPRTISASYAFTPEDSTNIQPSYKPQQMESSFQSSKRGIEEHIEDLGNQGAKRFKASPDSSILSVRSPYNSQDGGRIVTYYDTGEIVANRMQPGMPRYQNHTLQDYQMQLMLLEQQNKKRLMMARQENDERDTTDGCKPRDKPDCPASDRANGTYQAGGINNDISSTNSNSTVEAQHEAAQDEQLLRAASTVLGANIGASSQSFSVTAPDTAVPPMQLGSIEPNREKTMAVKIEEAHNHTLSRPESSPAVPVGDAPRTQGQQFRQEQGFPAVTQYPRRRSTPKSVFTEIPKLHQSPIEAPQGADVQSRLALSTMSPGSSRPNVQPPPQQRLYTAESYHAQPSFRPPSDPLVAGHQDIPTTQFSLPESLQRPNPSRPELIEPPSYHPLYSPSASAAPVSSRPLPVTLSNTQGFQQQHIPTPAAMGPPSYTLHHSPPVPIPSTSGCNQFESSPQSPIQLPNQQAPSYTSMQSPLYPHHVLQKASELETPGNGRTRQAMPKPLPGLQRPVYEQQSPAAPPSTQLPPGKASEYTNLHWLEDSKFICHFFRALGAGQFLQYSDLLNAVDHGMANGYLWCSVRTDEPWQVILGAKDSPLRSRQDLEHLLNRWRRGPVAFIQKSPPALSPSRSMPGMATQAIQMSDAPRVAVSPAQGPTINTQLEVVTKRQEGVPILLFHLLKATHNNASQWLQQLPLWLQDLRSLKDSLPRDEEALPAHKEQVHKKQAEIDMLEAKYEDLAQITPEAQQEELQQVREKAKLTMQRDVWELNTRLEVCLRGMQEKRARIENLEVCVRGLKSATPEAIEALKALVARLPDL